MKIELELEQFERLEKLGEELKEEADGFYYTVSCQWDGLTAQKQALFIHRLLKIQRELTDLIEDI